MPNASQRITDTTIKGMNSMFFMFNSLDERINIKFHPKFHIVINNVSRHEEDKDIDSNDNDAENTSNDSTASLSPEKRINDIKS